MPIADIMRDANGFTNSLSLMLIWTTNVGVVSWPVTGQDPWSVTGRPQGRQDDRVLPPVHTGLWLWLLQVTLLPPSTADNSLSGSFASGGVAYTKEYGRTSWDTVASTP